MSLAYAFREVKDTIPLVFLHGFLESSNMWRQLEVEDWNHSILLIDLPGHGQSMKRLPQGEPSIDLMADEVMEVLSSLKIDKFHLIGHSMGGYLGLAIKKRFSSCKKLILMNSTYLADTDEKRRDRLRLAELIYQAKDLIIMNSIPRLFYKLTNEDQVVKDLINEALQISPDAIAYASIAMSKRPANLDVIIENKADVLIINGKYDPILNVEILQYDTIKFQLNCIELSNSGHMSHFEEPALLIASIKKFIEIE